jgi:tRNA (cytidine56-2'-O)-methyltransferase
MSERVEITVLRLGHRVARDARTTTHAALVARAFGACGIILTVEDKNVKKTIEKINQNFGGDFKVSFVSSWKKLIVKWKKESNLIVHLTMYGMPVEEKIDEIRKAVKKKMLVIIGAEKVPGEVYRLADFNIAIGNQPHSEISALAIFLDRYFEGKELESMKKFKGKLKIIPSEKGKKVIKSD